MQPNEQVPPPTPTGPMQSNSRLVITIIVGVIAAVASGAIVTAVLNNDSDSSDTSTTSFLETTEATPYTSAAHNFRVDFNGFPEIENTTINVEGFNIPYSNYLAGDDEKVGGVIVADYSQFEELDIRAGLEGSVNGAVQNTPGAVLQEIEFITYRGREAATGYYTVPLNGQTVDGRILAIYNEKSLYGLLSIGLSEDEFNRFTESFEFTN